MRYTKFIVIIFIITFSILNGQVIPSIEWQKSLGGSNTEIAHSVQQTSDGGYIIAGESESTDGDVTVNYGDFDYWIIKLDPSGTIQWQKSLGGNYYDSAHSIQQTADGGYIIAGESNSTNGNVTGNHGNSDYWVVKLDSSGTIQWQKSFGGSANDRANAVQQTSDGGYIVAGESGSADGDVTDNHGSSDYWILKLDPSGMMQWQKSLGGSLSDRANSIQQTSDGGYIVAGGTHSTDGDITQNYGGEDFWIVKLNSSGIMQWQKTLVGNLPDRAQAIEQTSDGGYIVAGGSNSQNAEIPISFGISNYCVAKLDSNGNTIWQKHFGGSNNDYAYSIQQTSDEGYIVAGGTFSTDGNVSGNHGNNDYWILKLNSSGTIQWQKPLGGNAFDEAYSVKQTVDGGYIIAGLSTSTSGDVIGNHGNDDFWIVKLSSIPLLTEESNLINNKLIIYPNPAKDYIHIDHVAKDVTVSITDQSGRSIFVEKYYESRISISTSKFINGIYMIRVEHQGKNILSEKLIIKK